METANWRDIPGYEGLYQVTDRGEVRSLGRTTEFTDGRVRTFPPKDMKTPLDSMGYPHLGLRSREKTYRYFRVHELVMLAFGPSPSEQDTLIRHLNDNKIDNRIENLSWGSASDNMQDKFRNGYRKAKPRSCKRGHLFSGDNLIVQEDGRWNCKTCTRAYRRIKARNQEMNESNMQYWIERNQSA